MSKYFETITPEGLVQITDDTVCYTFKEKKKLGSYPLSVGSQLFTDDDFGRVHHATYNYQITNLNCGDDLFFVRNPSENGIAVTTAFGGPVFETFNPDYTYFTPVEKMGWWITTWGANKTVSDDLDVYIFSKDVTRRENVGFECFDSTGKIIFSSCSTPLKILLFNELVHTTSNKIVWTGDWTMQRTEHTYSGPIGVWLLAGGGGGTGGQSLGHTKHTRFYLKNNLAKISWYRDWKNEHNNVKDKWSYSPIYRHYGRETRYIIADLSNIKGSD